MRDNIWQILLKYYFHINCNVYSIHFHYTPEGWNECYTFRSVSSHYAKMINKNNRRNNKINCDIRKWKRNKTKKIEKKQNINKGDFSHGA